MGKIDRPETVPDSRKRDGTGSGLHTASYDQAANRLNLVELDGSRVTCGYDESYQLTSEVRSGTWPYDIAYQYDGASNRLVKVKDGQRTTSTYNAAQELTVIQHPDGTRTTLTWDPNRNLETETLGSATTTYQWDAENQIRQITEPPSTVNTYRYRAHHCRGIQQNDTSTKYLIWDWQNCALELTDGLAVAAEYSGYPGEWGGLASMRRGGACGLLHPDYSAKKL